MTITSNVNAFISRHIFKLKDIVPFYIYVNVHLNPPKSFICIAFRLYSIGRNVQNMHVTDLHIVRIVHLPHNFTTKSAY